MSRLMGNAQLRNELAAKAGDVAQRFSMEKVMGLWEELLARVVPFPAERPSHPNTRNNPQTSVQSPA
jgi:hypothetical protein